MNDMCDIVNKGSGTLYGIGVDIEDIARFKKIFKNTPFLKKVFTDREIAYCKRYLGKEAHLAARFAGKEAALKALGIKNGVTLRDIEILNADDGKPFVNLKKRNLKTRFIPFISISHSKTKAIAFCVVKKRMER